MYALIWERQGAGLSRGRRDVDEERVRARWNKRGETRRAFIWNGPSEGSDLIILGLRERKRGRERRATDKEKERERV